MGRGPLPKPLDIDIEPKRQTECLMLRKLAPEIRLMIWETLLAGLRLHIIQRSQRRLGFVVCPQEKDSCEICRGGLHQPVKDGERCSDWPLLSLPMTCKQMYVV
jgi:hypothetical protein